MTSPSELRVSKDRKLLTVTFPGQAPIDLTAEMLRVLSPSAEVQGHSAEQRITVPGKRDVTIMKIDPVGNYAVRIAFDDFHDTGIFTWVYLRQLGAEKETLWQAYLDELAQQGKSRDRR
ncbi:gamma-butyrobetaine hydroxylase-like domain-containing protein [Aquamicrobium segne]|uniref:Gamma-butyrobetaine hydroxylase-like domain-containing protein n=1 Tax=Aquamicrobium segne TaxID=469547 RepID=A0ABW0GX20_9HYPH